MKQIENFSAEKKLQIDFRIFATKLEKAKKFLNSRNINTTWFLNYQDSFKTKNIYSNLFSNTFNNETKRNITKEELDFTVEKLKETKKNLEDIEYELENNNSELKDIFLNELKFQINYVEMLINASFLEADKWWLIIEESILKEKNKKVIELQKKLYWPEITKEEEEKTINYLKKVFIENQDKLENDEKKIFKKFLKDSWIKEFNNFSKDSWIKEFENNDKEKIKFSIYDYKKIAEKYLEILEKINPSKTWVKLTDFEVVISKKHTMLTVNWKEKKIFLPETKQYNISSLALLDHELATHCYRSKKTTENIWWLNIWNYLESEEWNAMISEYFALWKEKIEKIKDNPIIPLISNFIWSKWNFEQTKKILEIYYTLISPKNTDKNKIERLAKNRATRVKWFHYLKEKGYNMKDLAYYRGMLIVWEKFLDFLDWKIERDEILDFLKQNYSIWKIWFNELELFKKYFSNYKDEKLPFFLWKLILEKLKWEKIFFQEYKEKDFRFEYEQVSYKIKRDIVEILKIIKKSFDS